MTHPIELPSLEQIQQMERQRQQAIELLEISDGTVKCQRCHAAVPIDNKMTRSSTNDRIDTLRVRLRWQENHDLSSREQNIKEIKQELDELLKEDAKYDLLRSLPLYSSKVTGFKFVCGECFERAFKRAKKR